MFSNKKLDLVVIGSATRDVFIDLPDKRTFKLDEFPTGEAICLGFGSKISVDKMVLSSGGGGTNTAVTFSRQGFKTGCVYVVGDDLNGQEILKELDKEGVKSFVQIHNDDLTAYSVILVGKNGERTILSYKGEGQHLDAGKIPFDEFNADWLVLSSLGGHIDVIEKSIERARKNNVKLAINPGVKELDYGVDKLGPLLKNFSVVVMNREEAARFIGISYQEEEKIFKFMDEAVDGIFVMTKGKEGVSVSDGKNIYSAGVPDSLVKERTGAGDAFFSGFVGEYIRSGDISKAIQFATANASSVVTEYGGKAGILHKDDWGKWSLVEVFKK